MKNVAGVLLVLTAAGCAGRGGLPAAPAPADPVAGIAPAPAPLAPELPTTNSFRQALERGSRTLEGVPGPAMWRSTVSYRIEAELDPSTARVRGYERIVYRNRSPDVLTSLVLNLYQNLFSEGVPRNRFAPITGGVELRSVLAGGQSLEALPTSRIPVSTEGQNVPVGYAVQGTLARIQLPRAIVPGDSAVLEIEWEHTVPPAPGFRTRWEESLGSRVFQVAQWYPQVAVYDDLRGWDATPYLGDGEFYLPYGDFDVALTVPVGYLVAATGELQNPEEVLTEEARTRLQAALGADSVTRIVTSADLTAENATQHSIEGQLTWRFSASDVRDFAFATSAGYVWDSTRILGSEADSGARAVAVHAFYRPEAPHWREAADFSRHSTTLIGEFLVPYAYPQITVAEGPIGGMEYPMLNFIGRFSTADQLYGVIAHEAAHQWLPMMVGTDEAAFAWMDEGLATYLEALSVAERFGQPAAWEADRAAYLAVAGSDVEVPLMRHTDLVSPYGARAVAAYAKPAVLFRALEWVLGSEKFQGALRDFIVNWEGLHPTPWDFFATMERAAGGPLGWFFLPWWYGTGVLDQAIAGVEADESGRAVVTIESLGEIAAPTIVAGTTASGASVTAALSVDAWAGGARSVTVELEASDAIVTVVLDPQQIFPDVARENNEWRR